MKAIITVVGKDKKGIVAAVSAKIAELGLYPAINVFKSTSKLIDKDKIGERHFSLVERVLANLTRYEELEEIIAVLGIEEL